MSKLSKADTALFTFIWPGVAFGGHPIGLGHLKPIFVGGATGVLL